MLSILQINGIKTVIRKKLTRKDPRYQRVINKLGLQNSNDMPDDSAFITTTTKNKTGAKAGRIASRRTSSQVPIGVRRGDLLTADLDNNIFEVIRNISTLE